MEQIFVSYSRADKDFVDSLSRDIEAFEIGKFDVWMDRADISGGDDWYKAISRAIRACSYFLLVLSPNSVKSQKVSQELSLADKHGKRIIPLMYQRCEIPEELELLLVRPQLIDCAQNYGEALRKLRGALGQKQQQANVDTQSSSFNPITPTPPPPLNLIQVLPGQWDATVMYPMMPPVKASVWVSPDGAFQAQQLPVGLRFQGRWAVNQGNQIYTQGFQTDGYMTTPFVGGLQVLAFDQNQISGIGPSGEQVVWRRIR